MKVVVIGLGNRFRSDDAAGLDVARRVAERAPGDVFVLEHEGDPVGILDAWTGADLALVVDAVRGDAPDGTVSRIALDAETSIEAATSDSSHALGLVDAVLLARTLDRMPQRLVLYGVTGSTFDAGAGPTPAVAAAVTRCADRILDELTEARAGCA